MNRLEVTELAERITGVEGLGLEQLGSGGVGANGQMPPLPDIEPGSIPAPVRQYLYGDFPEGETPGRPDDVRLLRERDEPSDDDSAALTPRQEAIIRRYIPLAVRLAQAASIDKEEFEEALGNGFRALVRSARVHDPDKINPLASTGSGYIGRSIWGEIQKGMRDQYGRIGDSIAKVKPSVMSGSAASLDAPLPGYENEVTLGDLMSSPVDQDRLEFSAVGADLLRALRTVHRRDREIFLRCAVFGQTREEVSQIFGLHKMEVGRIKNRVAASVRESLSDYGYAP